eukprot:scaffold5178_cov141-Skeletonema_menzelii.AAC.3
MRNGRSSGGILPTTLIWSKYISLTAPSTIIRHHFSSGYCRKAALLKKCFHTGDTALEHLHLDENNIDDEARAVNVAHHYNASIKSHMNRDPREMTHQRGYFTDWTNFQPLCDEVVAHGTAPRLPGCMGSLFTTKSLTGKRPRKATKCKLVIGVVLTWRIYDSARVRLSRLRTSNT